MSGRTLFVGRLSYDVRSRDLEDFFYKYRPTNIELKRGGFAFVEFKYREDAEDALEDLDNRDLLGKRVSIELARGKRRSSRDSDVCFRCGKEGHWARSCSSRRRSRSGSRSPRRRSRRSSRSPSRSKSRSRSRSPKRERKPSRSRSASPRGDRSPRKTEENNGNNNKSPAQSPRKNSPEHQNGNDDKKE